MNIFVVDLDPEKAARNLKDKHVHKMTLETAQMLSTCHKVFNNKAYVYSESYINHPCNIWLRESKQNYNWLYEHFYYLSDEYENRYFYPHKSFIILKDVLKHPPNSLPDIGYTERPQCMPGIYKDKDIVIAYRNYYAGDKLRNATWIYPGVKPDWIAEHVRLVNSKKA